MSESLTVFDVIVLFVVGASFLYALVKGLTTMLLTVAAWLGAILVTLYGMEPVSGLAQRFIEPATLANFIALPLLFITSLVVFKLAADALGRRVRTGPAGLLDRSAGAGLGLLLGAVLVSSGYLFFSSILPEERHPGWVREAQLQPLVAYGAVMVAKTGPQLFARMEDDEGGEALINRMRETYDHGRDKARSLSEAAYNEAQRRLLEQKLQELSEGDDSGADEESPENNGGNQDDGS